MTSPVGAPPGVGAAPAVTTYVVRCPKMKPKKKFSILEFRSGGSDADFTKWGNVKLERENNHAIFKGGVKDNDDPTHGAGSEFGKQQREDARRKKIGIRKRIYNEDNQPWLLKMNGKTGKRYKGVRKGTISENAGYYVFTQATDGAFEAYPVNEWYNFTMQHSYKTLSAEEVEDEFGKRNRTLNYFSIMMKKRLKNDEDEEEEGTTEKKKKGKDFMISEMEEWDKSSDESNSDDTEQDKEDRKSKKKKNLKDLNKKRKNKRKSESEHESDEEPKEESDDGDSEGKECDYISDSSDSDDTDPDEKVKNEMSGVDRNSAMKKMLDSGEEDSSDEEKKDEEEEEKEKSEEEENKKEDKKKKKKDKKKKKKGKSEPEKESKEKVKTENSNSSGSDIDPDETDLSPGSSKKTKSTTSSTSSSRATTPTQAIIDAVTGDHQPPPSKKIKLELPPDCGVTEEAVRRYLMRKPMTTTELCLKFKNKKCGLTSEQLVTGIAQLLQKISPIRQTIKSKMYLSLKPEK